MNREPTSREPGFISLFLFQRDCGIEYTKRIRLLLRMSFVRRQL
jgi:hypothetical protein